jgi:hypothetical protein
VKYFNNQTPAASPGIRRFGVQERFIIANSSSVKCFNNQTPDGKLVQGNRSVVLPSINELTTDAELALLKSS